MQETYDALVTAWLDGRRSENTRAAYRTDLAAFAQWCSAHGRVPLRATADDIARYQVWCEGEVAPATVARRISAVTSFFKFALADGDPTRGVVRRTAPSASSTPQLDGQQAAALLRAADRAGVKTSILVRLLLVDGLRLGEVVGADVRDLDLDGAPPTVTVERAGRPTSLALRSATATRVGRYVGPRRSGPLLLGDAPGRQVQRLSRFGADYLLKRAGESARLPVPLSANMLRRRHVAAAHERGDDIDDIRVRVGHRDVRTTRRYLTADESVSTTTRR